GSHPGSPWDSSPLGLAGAPVAHVTVHWRNVISSEPPWLGARPGRRGPARRRYPAPRACPARSRLRSSGATDSAPEQCGGVGAMRHASVRAHSHDIDGMLLAPTTSGL